MTTASDYIKNYAIKKESKSSSKTNNHHDEVIKDRFKDIYSYLQAETKDDINEKTFEDFLSYYGLSLKQPMFKSLASELKTMSAKSLSLESLMIHGKQSLLLLEKVIKGQEVIPDFNSFRDKITELYNDVKKNKDGNVADYIPQLARVNPEYFGLSVMTVDGQTFSLGESEEPFSVQSTSKPISYCIALEDRGEELVHNHVGQEPSGMKFNQLALNDRGLPHNPMINAGAIMTASLIKPQLESADRFDYVLSIWNKLFGDKKAGFNNSVYLSERQSADRNFALGYLMREHKAFEENFDLVETLEFYFQCCSIEANCQQMAALGATLANGGFSPLTGEQIFSQSTIKNALSLMSSCGMYDYSGEFAFTVGLPAKSGVSGLVLVVVPNLCSFAIWSPRLDKIGNSVRGVDFCRKLVETFNFHAYDSLLGHTDKINPRYHPYQVQSNDIGSLCWAASDGDLKQVRQLISSGIDPNNSDYDGRTALHLAAGGNHLEVVKELVLRWGVKPNPIDRWGATPEAEAKSNGYTEIAEWLIQHQSSVTKSSIKPQSDLIKDKNMLPA